MTRRVQPPALIRALRSSPRRQRLLAEAAMLLAIAAAGLAFLPFRKAARLSCRRVPTGPPQADAALLIAEVRSAVESAAARMPFRAKCFERGLAAQMMLRRRGVDAILYYGAALRPVEGLQAHVWVRAGTDDVIGCEDAESFGLLARFPAG